MRSFPNENIHASSRRKLNWNSINWKKVRKKVKELQIRIAKAVREGSYRKEQSLQWLLTHSFHAKLLAVKRIATNKGAGSTLALCAAEYPGQLGHKPAS